MTKDSSAKRKAGKRKPEKLSFTQDFIPIKNLEHGIIETTDGRYIKILEVEPINFMLRSEEEQYEIICSFASWLKISPGNGRSGAQRAEGRQRCVARDGACPRSDGL